MALVRCPTHGIPYNDDNPRGCPACALEKEGGGEQATLMRELARASQSIRRPSGVAAADPSVAEPPRRRSERLGMPVTQQPRAPVPEPSVLDRLRVRLRARPIPTVGVPLIVVFLTAILLRSRHEFLNQPSPVPLIGEVLPLPIETGTSMTTVFAILGQQSPGPSPDGRTLERYAYGSDLVIDALNGAVYRISLMVPNRSWHGLRVGMPEQQAEGTLALLGIPRPAGPPTTPRADTLSGYVVYPSLDQRPKRSVKAEVRPPNGCYDAIVEVQPRAAGILVSGDRRYAAIGPPRMPMDWVAVRVIAVNRAVAGPNGPAAC